MFKTTTTYYEEKKFLRCFEVNIMSEFLRLEGIKAIDTKITNKTACTKIW